MPVKITRRALAVGAAVPAALSQAPPPSPAKEDPAELLAAQREQIRRNLEQIRNFKLPTSTEPAFRFEA
jgi:hypothetical protein